MPYLVIKREGLPDEAIRLTEAALSIGRNEENSVRIDDEKISRRHCQIVFIGGAYRLLDLESGNGTFLRGERIQKIELHPGDDIRLGNTTIFFVNDLSSVPSSQSSNVVPPSPPSVPPVSASPLSGSRYSLPVDPQSVTSVGGGGYTTRPPQSQLRSRVGDLKADKPPHTLFHATALLLFVILLVTVAITDLSFDTAPDVGAYWARKFSRSSASEPRRKNIVVEHRSDSSTPEKSIEASTDRPSNPPNDFAHLSRIAFESLTRDVQNALAANDWTKAEESVSSFKRSSLSAGLALELFNIERVISDRRREHAAKEREIAARREARFKEIEGKVQQAVAAEDFDGAKEIAATFTDDPRAQSLVALVEKARQDHIAQRLPRRRDFYGSMLLVLRPMLMKRDYAGALNKIETLKRDAEFKLHLPMLEREEERLKHVDQAYRAILDAVRNIPKDSAITIIQKDGRAMKNKYSEIRDDILWLDYNTIGVRSTDITMGSLVALALSQSPNVQDARTLQLLNALTRANLYLYDEDFVVAATAIAEIIDDDAALEFFARLEMTQKALRDADQPALTAAVEREIAKGNLAKAESLVNAFDHKYSFPVFPDAPIAPLATGHLQLVTDLRSRLSSAGSSVMIGNIAYARLKILREPGRIDEKVTLLKSLKVVGGKEVVPFIASALKDEAAQVRLEGARATVALSKHISAHPDRGEIVWTLILLLNDPAAEVGFAAADAVKAVGYSANEILDRAKENPEEIFRAVVAAGMLADERLAPLVRDSLTSVDWRIRKESALALAKIRDKSAGAALVTALKKEPHDDVVAAIAYALGAIEYGSGVGPVNDILKRQPDHPYKKELVQAIARMGGGSVSAALKPMLKDLDPWIRHYAVEGLVESGTKLKEEEVVHLLADDRWLNRAGAVKALIAGGETKSLDTIVKTLDDAHPAVRATAHHGLMMAKDVRVIPEIVKHLDALGGEGKTLAQDILKRLTKQNFATTNEWKNWWTTSGGSFRLPSVEERYKIPEPERRKP